MFLVNTVIGTCISAIFCYSVMQYGFKDRKVEEGGEKGGEDCERFMHLYRTLLRGFQIGENSILRMLYRTLRMGCKTLKRRGFAASNIFYVSHLYMHVHIFYTVNMHVRTYSRWSNAYCLMYETAYR